MTPAVVTIYILKPRLPSEAPKSFAGGQLSRIHVMKTVITIKSCIVSFQAGRINIDKCQ